MPSSTLPLKTVIEPSAAMTSHESSWFAGGGSGDGRIGGAATSVARAEREADDQESACAVRKSRRESVIASHRRLRCWSTRCSCRRAFDRAHDPHVRSAAAEVAVQRRANLRARRLLVARDERRGRHDHPVDAVAALRGLLVDERLLDRMRLVGRAESFDRRDGSAGGGGERRRARANRVAVDVHHARAALSEPAAELGAGEAEVVAQDVEQRRVGRGGDVVRRAVDDQAGRDARRHKACPVL